MKFQPKRFVVEVKRGTSRAAFSSPDTSSDKFSNAEASLFGGAPKSESQPLQAKDKSPSRPETRAEPRIFADSPRRILESLIAEPVAPVVDDDEPIERPRRGRKPGSKNKPKLVAPAISDFDAPAFRPLSPEAQAFMGGQRSPEAYSFQRDVSLAEHRTLEPTRSRVAADATSEGVASEQRQRLRERSSIIKRYVLGTEPRPGQIGSLRARRKARAAG